MLLPWWTVSLGGFGGGSGNGFRSWGLLSLCGIIGVAVSCFRGDKTKEFDENFKKIALASFAAIALGAIIFFARLSSSNSGLIGVNTGFGLWICLVAGLAGLGWLLGFIKLESKKPPSTPQ
jgi:hypothetical protein